MPKYKYEIQKADNKMVSGVVEADSLADASAIVQRQGGYLINIEPFEDGDNLFSRLQNVRLEFLPGLKDVLYFTKQLSVMIRAGISIRDAVEMIADQVENQRFKKILDEIRFDVESGLQFSAALAKHPRVFSKLYVNMVRASELSGTFAHMLDRIALYLEQQAETRSMVRGAMIYPAVLFVMSVSAVIFLLAWVLPKFMVMFRDKQDRLPKPTVMLMAISDFLRDEWYFLVAGLALLIIGFILSQRTEQGRMYFDLFKLKAPVFKRLFRSIYIARGLQTMGELVNAGVPMLETLTITADISGNVIYYNMWMRVRDSVQEGSKIVYSLQRDNMMPRSVVQMISAGEESGRLGDVLTDVSAFYTKEMKDTIKAVTTLLEPVMIVFMGFVIGFIAMSIILPIFKMSQMQKK